MLIKPRKLIIAVFLIGIYRGRHGVLELMPVACGGVLAVGLWKGRFFMTEKFAGKEIGEKADL